MNRTALTLTAAAIAVLLAGGSFYLGRVSASHRVPAAAAAGASPPGERTVLYWHDPMVPGPRFDKPGKSPFMDMQLVPVYAGDNADAGVQVSPAVQQNLGIRTVAAQRRDVSSSFDAVGTVQFDERLAVAVQTRVAGYVERLAVRAPMERVRQGQALATVFAPDWLAPLNELAALKRAGVAPELVDAARDRTRALSIPAALVRQAEDGAAVSGRFTLTAPASGVVAELGVRDGAMVSPGMTMFRIAGLDRVWAVAEVPEAQAVHLVRGQRVKAVLQADAAQAFEGRLAEILPQVNASSRTLQARFEVANPGGRLVPGMLLRLQVAGPTTTRLVVPAEAVIRTGTRAVAIVRRADGRFEPREVQLGVDLGDTLEVVRGLAEGDSVVASGQFLVDSEARLRSVLGSMGAADPAAAPASSAAAATYSAEGRVERVEADNVTLTHGPIPELKWPGMTMGFGKPDPKAFADLKPGDRVHFEFRKGGPLDYELVSVHRLGGAK
jgi:Cu(I)/Ag(I) efflux system membrane fusion protein